jgi:hypothetical protein
MTEVMGISAREVGGKYYARAKFDALRAGKRSVGNTVSGNRYIPKRPPMRYR